MGQVIKRIFSENKLYTQWIKKSSDFEDLCLISAATTPAKVSYSTFNNSIFNHNLKGKESLTSQLTLPQTTGRYRDPPFGEINKDCQKSQHLSWHGSSGTVCEDQSSRESSFVSPLLGFSLLNSIGPDTMGLIIVFWLINITGTLFVDPQLLSFSPSVPCVPARLPCSEAMIRLCAELKNLMGNIHREFRTQLVITRQPCLLRASILRFILP